MCIQHTLDEFFHLVFLLLNTYFNSHMRYSNIFLLNNIKLCLYDSEKRFRNGRTAPPIFISERVHGACIQIWWRSTCMRRGLSQVGPTIAGHLLAFGHFGVCAAGRLDETECKRLRTCFFVFFSKFRYGLNY